MSNPVESPASGTVRRIEIELGDRVEAGDVVIILAGRDAEVLVEAESDGVVSAIQVSEGEQVSEGDVLALLD